jgi:Zn-dependent oligopeptidase
MWDRLSGLMTTALLVGRPLLAADAVGAPASGASLRTVADLQAAAARTKAVVALPVFESTADAIEATTRAVIAEANQKLDALAAQDPAKATFESTVAALDVIGAPVSTAGSRIYLMKETQPNASMRDAATSQIQALQEWSVGVTYREDVYRAVKAFADAYEAGKRPTLEGEPLKLYEDTMRDYRRAGLTLDKPTRDKVEALQKQLARVSTDFDKNISEAKHELVFTAGELAGVREEFLKTIRREDGKYVVLANVTPHRMAVMENAKSEETRKAVDVAYHSLAQKENAPLLDKMVALRDEITGLLGYASWADYQIEPRMAKTAARATAILEDLRRGLQPKFQAELAEYRRLKVRDTGDANAQILSWDWRYYENQLRKEKYAVDTEQLRVFFSFERVLRGMFDVYERIFGLRFEQLQSPDPWYPGVNLYATLDAATGEPLGLFYMDNFPREGKYNHFAQFGIVDGRLLPDGRYQRPVVALVCNFAPPSADDPSLLDHREVETLFHEFGHGLHSMLTRARFGQFSGTNVPRDFVEAPSQMLENWVWDATVLNGFAADYREPSKKIDPGLLDKMLQAKLATTGTFYSRQAALALADLKLHAAPSPGVAKDSRAILNDVFGRNFLEIPEGGHLGAYWGHLTGYDAGYYGYLWSEAIAADMASVFESAPGRFLDAGVGRRLRDEVYAVGGSRDAEVSIRRFLGRERSNEPFLKSVGLK